MLLLANKQAMSDYRKLHPKRNQGSNGQSSGRGGSSGHGRGHGSGQGSSQGRPNRKLASDGKPLKLNQHGLYVLDTKRWHTMQTERRIDQVTALIANGVPGASSASSGTPAPDTTPPPAAAPSAATAAAPSNGRADKIRAAVAWCFSS